MRKSSFLAELRRRNVIRMAGLYLVGAWLIVQVAGTVLPMYGAPAWMPRTIVTLLAIGFLPTMVFAWIFEFTADGLKRDAEVDPAESIAPQTAQRLNRTIVAVLLLALTYFGVDKFVLAPQRGVAQQVATVKATEARVARQIASQATTISAKSIAVLPLDNASGDEDQLYFSDGLSEDLITALSQFEGLKVISRNSAFQFRDSKQTSKAIGAKLGVAHLLEGSVRKLGDTVRITAQLVKASDGSTLWSQRYDRPYQDLFALQDEIVQAVASALKVQLLAGSSIGTQSDRPPSGNLAAYTTYLQGRQYAITAVNEADDLKAIDALTTAIRLDPGYARAYANIATTWLNISRQRTGAPAQQAIAQSRAAITTALALDPDNAEAHNALGGLHKIVDRDWIRAEAEYRRAIQLAPVGVGAKINLAGLLTSLGHPGQAIDLLHQALAIDPLRQYAYLRLADALTVLGHLDEAEQALRKAIELQPGTASTSHGLLAIIEILRGNAKAALAEARQMPADDYQEITVALALQIGDDRAAADAALQAVIGQHAAGWAYQIAQAYALRHDPDQTFEWLDRALKNSDPGLQSLLADPFLQRYKHDPRFAAIARKVGLPVPVAAAPATSTPVTAVKSAP